MIPTNANTLDDDFAGGLFRGALYAFNAKLTNGSGCGLNARRDQVITVDQWISTRRQNTYARECFSHSAER
jgi:hypothetical protein